jgi:transcriptional regulator with XRE-family HTH domain
MSIEVQKNIRMKKLGVLLRDARLAAHKSCKEIAGIMGVTSGILKAYEEGRKAPGLPEVEILAYSLNLPMSHFWSSDAISDNISSVEKINLDGLVRIRQRMIGALLRKQRMEAGISLRSLSGQSGISTKRLKSYEMGMSPIPVPVLEGLFTLLNGRIEDLFDQSGPVGKWLVEKRTIQEFLQLSPELQAFVCKPVNRPYLELALSLSGLSTEKLRSVGESLLDITL